MSRIIFILPFLFLSLLSLSATVIVKGTAASYTGQYISLFAFDDLLTGKRILLQSDLIDDNGTFEITCEIAETQKTILAINNVEAVLYVEPGLTYTIDYPPFQTADLQRFDRTEIQLKVHYLPDNDLNLLIRSFDAEMNSFFDEHYFEIAEEQYRGSEAFKVRQLHNGSAPDMIPVKKIGESDSSLKVVAPTRKAELINGFYKRVDQRFGRYLTHHYFSEYVRYSKAQIDLVSGKSKKELYREYFMSQKV
ncbi:MAG: hypothetical protein IT223_11205, partial [Crocinitomicaceae bacterium]|nr:hypothetical protein [Crocinitomicaceae bacterium]